jgi:hypothetical protein
MREKHSPEMLREIYAEPHDHSKFEDHLLRVDATISVAHWMMRDKSKYSVADLSCGNAHIVADLVINGNASQQFLGDFAEGYSFVGPIEETINSIPHVDLFVFSETVEHVDDPTFVLNAIREKSDRLVLSTPIDEKFEDNNREHYWAWDIEGMEYLLKRSKWEPVTKIELTYTDWFFPYNFQIWGCK